MSIDVTGLVNDLFIAGTAGAGIALAWTVAGWTLKSIHLLTRTENERNYDASRDWDDKGSTDGRWYD